MRPVGDTPLKRRPIIFTTSLLVGLSLAILLGEPMAAQSNETVVVLRPLEPAATVRMLSAPHTGKKTCEIRASTPIRFIAPADHGPHRYARVEVLEGDCAGEQGYVPWTTLDPEPRKD
jgi:hypothetical protein